jgi:hypothetical protein
MLEIISRFYILFNALTNSLIHSLTPSALRTMDITM